MSDYEGDFVDEGAVETTDLIRVSEPTVLEAVDRAAIDVQISTAHAYPRSVERFQREARELATLDADTAGECFYTLPRAGKDIVGPSIRLAEIVASTWGNLRVDGRIVSEEKEFVTAQGTCFDLERNVAVRKEKKRRIIDKKGKRYAPDMIMQTSNAAVSLAIRDAVFGVVPRALVKPIYEAARTASLGKGTMEEKRENAIAWFGKQGIDEERLFAALEIKGRADLGEDELIRLRGIKTAIQDGEIAAETTFPRPGAVANEDSRDLNEMLRQEGAAPVSGHAGPSTPEDRPAAAEDQGAGGPDSDERSRDAASVETAPDEPRDGPWDHRWRLDEPPPVLDHLGEQLAAIHRLDTLDRLEAAERANDNRKTAIERIDARRRALQNGREDAATERPQKRQDGGDFGASPQQIGRIKALLDEREIESDTELRIWQRIARQGYDEADAADVIELLEALPPKAAVTA